MSKIIFVNLPGADLTLAVSFYDALGFTKNPAFSDDTAACMVWSEAIHAMLTLRYSYNQQPTTHHAIAAAPTSPPLSLFAPRGRCRVSP